MGQDVQGYAGHVWQSLDHGTSSSTAHLGHCGISDRNTVEHVGAASSFRGCRIRRCIQKRNAFKSTRSIWLQPRLSFKTFSLRSKHGTWEVTGRVVQWFWREEFQIDWDCKTRRRSRQWSLFTTAGRPLMSGWIVLKASCGSHEIQKWVGSRQSNSASRHSFAGLIRRETHRDENSGTSSWGYFGSRRS